MVTFQVIMLNPASPLGYERKHAALRGAGHYRDAEVAFETMLSIMSKSSDSEIRGEGDDIVLCLPFDHLPQNVLACMSAQRKRKK